LTTPPRRKAVRRCAIPATWSRSGTPRRCRNRTVTHQPGAQATGVCTGRSRSGLVGGEFHSPCPSAT
jgi:hypothetical protein